MYSRPLVVLLPFVAGRECDSGDWETCRPFGGNLSTCIQQDCCLWSDYDKACTPVMDRYKCPVENYHHCSTLIPTCDPKEDTCATCSGDAMCTWRKSVNSNTKSGYLWTCAPTADTWHKDETTGKFVFECTDPVPDLTADAFPDKPMPIMPGPDKPMPGPDEPMPAPSGHFNDALAFIQGFSNGLFNDETLSNCLLHVAETVPSVKSSIDELLKALRSFKPLQIVKAIKNFEKTLKGVPQELQDCGANLQNVKGLLAALKETVPAIIGEFASAKDSLDQKNYEDFGEHVGHALSLLVSHPTSLAASGASGAGSAALEVIVGLSDGYFGDHGLSTCIASVLEKTGAAKSALDELTNAVKSKNPFKMLKAFKDLKQAVKSLPDMLKPCGDHVQSLETSLKTLMKVGSEFVDDNVQAFHSLQAHDFGKFGEYIGKAMRIVAHGDEPQDTSIVV